MAITTVTSNHSFNVPGVCGLGVFTLCTKAPKNNNAVLWCCSWFIDKYAKRMLQLKRDVLTLHCADPTEQKKEDNYMREMRDEYAHIQNLRHIAVSLNIFARLPTTLSY